jgi:hypothetical protein
LSKTNYIDLIIFLALKKGVWGFVLYIYTEIARDPSAGRVGPLVHKLGWARPVTGIWAYV